MLAGSMDTDGLSDWVGYIHTRCTTASRCLRMQYSTSGLPPAMSVSSGALTRTYTCVCVILHIYNQIDGSACMRVCMDVYECG